MAAPNLLSILNYETKVTPGSYFRLVTDWFESDEEIQTIIIDQDNYFIKMLSVYPKGFFMYLEQDQKGAIYRTNYPLYRVNDGDYYSVDWDVEPL